MGGRISGNLRPQGSAGSDPGEMPGLTVWTGHHPKTKPMSKTNEKKIISNLHEFLAWRGFGADEAYTWARCFYKYTDCGPWAVFLMRDQPARADNWTMIVGRDRKGNLKAAPGGPLNAPGELPPEDILSRFGFDGRGRPAREDRECMTSLETYRKALEAYSERLSGRDDLSFSFYAGPSDPKPGCRKWILITIKRPVAETFREIYYEDISDHNQVDPDLCVGIKFGSIVEGSEACSGPFEHMFPFDAADFDSDVESMEGETSHYWERDNSQWYKLQVADRDYYVHNTWGDISWDGDKPSPKLRRKVEEFIAEHGEDIPSMPGMWTAKPDWKPLRIPGTRADIHEYTNDSTY